MSRAVLIDVTRLLWRFWTRRWPTGIDRVCLAYAQHFGDRAQAVVQFRGHYRILSPQSTRRLLGLLRAWRRGSRARLVIVMAAGLLTSKRTAPAGAFYLNVGHTGLDQTGLREWIAMQRLRAVYFVHDLIPLTHPHFCRDGEADKHALRMTNVLASAAGVIGNSQATLTSLADFAAARGMAMPPTVAAWISGPTPRNVVPSSPPLATPYFVTLGTIEGRKNHLLLLELWRGLVDEFGAAAPTLAVIGQRGWQASAALGLLDQASQFGGKVVELNSCSDAQLAHWLAGARALLMPSFAEGFGLPLIEAMQLGTPVIASDLPVFREIGASIPSFVDPRNPEAWKARVIAYLDEDPDRRRQVELLKNYRAPNWEQHFALVDDWLASLL